MTIIIYYILVNGMCTDFFGINLRKSLKTDYLLNSRLPSPTIPFFIADYINGKTNKSYASDCICFF